MNSLIHSSTIGRKPVIAAPIAMPSSAVSEIGVIRMRSFPNIFSIGSRSVIPMFARRR